jgi:septal ring factor EnvC (AmiA/AmiB activator)
MKDSLSLLIEQHRKEIWGWKMKESEWIKTQNQLDGAKQIISELSNKIIQCEKEIDRLSEENSNIKIVTSNSELDEVKRDNKRLAEQVSAYREMLSKAGL